MLPRTQVPAGLSRAAIRCAPEVLVPLVVRREARKEMPANLAMLKQHLETES